MTEVTRRSVQEIREIIKMCVEMGVTEIRMDDLFVKVEQREKDVTPAITKPVEPDDDLIYGSSE
jgi:hypothetical protein